MIAIGLDRPLVQGDDLLGIAAQGGHGGGALGKVLGGLLDGAGERIQHSQRRGGIAGIAERFRLAQGALAGGIARLLGGLVARQGFLVLLPGEMALGQVVVGHGAAVGLPEDFDRPIVPPQQIQTHAQPDAGWPAYAPRGFAARRRRRAGRRIARSRGQWHSCICRTSRGPKVSFCRTVCFRSNSTVCAIVDCSCIDTPW